MIIRKWRVIGFSNYLSIFLKTDRLFPTSLLVKQQIHCQCIFVFKYLILEQTRMLLFLFATQKEKLQLCTSRNGNGVQNRVTSFFKEHVYSYFIHTVFSRDFVLERRNDHMSNLFPSGM